MDDTTRPYKTVIARALVELETGDPREAAKILRSVADPDAPGPKPYQGLPYIAYRLGWPYTETQYRD